MRERRRPGEIHPHQPVGAGAGVGGVGQRVEVGERAQRLEAAPDRLWGERRDPQPADGLAATDRRQDVAEDQLALAAGVGGAHDLGDVGVAQDLLHRTELALRPVRDDERPLGRQQGEVPGRPALPLRPYLRRLGQANEVADGPGHDVAAAAQPALAPLRRAQDAGDVAGHRRLLGHDGDRHGARLTRRGYTRPRSGGVRGLLSVDVRSVPQLYHDHRASAVVEGVDDPAAMRETTRWRSALVGRPSIYNRSSPALPASSSGSSCR